MANIKMRGIVTREVKYSENSRILTVLSEDLGKMSVLASRSRLNRSGALVATQLFSYSEFEVFKGRDTGMVRLNEAMVIESFGGLRKSLEKMAYASYFCDVANHLCYEGTEQNEILRLLLNSLSKLENIDNDDIRDDEKPENTVGGKINTEFKYSAVKIEAVFLLRALMEAGFAPNCDGCLCGSGEKIELLCVSDGVFCCGNCAEEKKGKYNIAVNNAVYKAISHIITSKDSAAFSFVLGEKNLKYLADVAECYMTYELENSIKTLDYLKAVRDMQ